MSVAQVKKHFEDLAAYLGRDVTGLEKLRKLKEAVNVVRTTLASAQESSEAAIARMEAATSDAISVKAELTECRLDNHRLRQRVESLARELALATTAEPIDATKDEDEVEDIATPDKPNPQFRAVMKRLRGHLAMCPAVVARRETDATLYGYDREAFSKGWSHEALWILGASVAALAAFSGEVLIMSHEKISELEGTGHSYRHHFIQWIRRSIEDIGKHDPLCALQIQARVSRSDCNWGVK